MFLSRNIFILVCTGFLNDTSKTEPGTQDARLGNQEVPSAPWRGCITHFIAKFICLN